MPQHIGEHALQSSGMVVPPASIASLSSAASSASAITFVLEPHHLRPNERARGKSAGASHRADTLSVFGKGHNSTSTKHSASAATSANPNNRHNTSTPSTPSTTSTTSTNDTPARGSHSSANANRAAPADHRANSRSVTVMQTSIPAAGASRGYGVNPGDDARPTNFWTGSFDINHSHSLVGDPGTRQGVPPAAPPHPSACARSSSTSSRNPYVKARERQYGVPFYVQMKTKVSAAMQSTEAEKIPTTAPATTNTPKRRSSADFAHKGSALPEETGGLTAHWPAAGVKVGSNSPAYHNYSSSRGHLDHGYKSSSSRMGCSSPPTPPPPSRSAGKRSSRVTEYTPQHVKYTSHWGTAHADHVPSTAIAGGTATMHARETVAESNSKWVNDKEVLQTAARAVAAGVKTTPRTPPLQMGHAAQRSLFA